jgi:hypothetical protein
MNENRPAKVKVTHGCRVIIIILFTHWHTVHSKMYYTPTTFKRSTTLIKRLLVRFKQTSYIPRSKFRDHHTNSHSQRDHLQRYCYSRTYPHAHSSINTPYYYNQHKHCHTKDGYTWMQQRHISRTYMTYNATLSTSTLSGPSSYVNMLRKKNRSTLLSNNSQLCELTCAPRPST